MTEITENRTVIRFLCADIVRVSWADATGLKTLEAVLEDISPLGACIQVEEPIPPDVELTLAADDNNLSGVVSYCVYRDYGFFAGIRFLGTNWSTGIFLPQHLIDLRVLVARCAD